MCGAGRLHRSKCSRQLQVWASLEGLPRPCVLPLQWLASSAARVCLTRHTHLCPTPELSRADPLTQTDDSDRTETGTHGQKGKKREEARLPPLSPQSAPHTHEYKCLRVQKLGFVWACVVLCREVDWNDWRVVSAVSGIHLVVVGRGESQQRACRDRHW